VTSVLISGASIAGPALASWLHRYGFEVTVIERAAELRPGGQNVDVRGAGREVARRMGLEDAIRAATTVAARLLGWADRAGRLLPGYRADVVAVDGSPLDDVHALERVKLVIAQGAVARQDPGIT